MLSSLRYFVSDVFNWLLERRWRLALALGALLLLAGAAIGGYLIADDDSGEVAAPAAAPRVLLREVPEPEVTEDLGFPGFATANTTRVAGADAITNAAAVALAAYPSTGGVEGPAAVTLVDVDDWPSGVAAASLAADPIGAPILVTDSGDIPELTTNALRALAPSGSGVTNGQQAFRVGDAAEPAGLETLDVEGANPAEIASELDRLRARLARGTPEHVLLASSEDPAFAVPAAAWAARSGDPIFFVQHKSVPAPTREALERYKDVPVYVLGPESAISADALAQVRELAPSAKRIAGQDPVSNSIAFARYSDAGFGWNINDPGHGLVIANADRPLDDAVASPLSASGTWGPLLLSEEPEDVPAELRGYLLDLKPGYEDDPTRAVYNHAWLIGDTTALSVAFQAQVDELVALAPIGSGR
jgi:hypothetical protein